MKKNKIYMAPETFVIAVNTETFMANSPIKGVDDTDPSKPPLIGGGDEGGDPGEALSKGDNDWDDWD